MVQDAAGIRLVVLSAPGSPSAPAPLDAHNLIRDAFCAATRCLLA
jgi:hypothetical protein